MKRKLFFILLMSVLCVMMLTVVASAKDVDIKINDAGGNSIVLPSTDSEGEALTWYRVTEKPSEGTYFEYVDGSTTYYIVSVKTKDAAYVNDSYRICYSYPGLTAGAWSGNIMLANFDGLTHTDGTGPELLNFLFEGTPICYVYIPASITDLRAQSGKDYKSLFYGCSNLVGIDFEADSKIETLHTNGFYNCRKLTYIKLPENLKTISANAFVSLNLTLVVPKSVTTYEASNYSSHTVQFTGTASDHATWTYQPSNITYVNHCDAYYEGSHAGDDDGDCTTALLCQRCSTLLQEARDSHNNQTIAKYENGYTENGYMRSGCVNCECYEEVTLNPLFKCLGYSLQEYADGGISISFLVDHDAILDYETATGEKLIYGVFAVAKQNAQETVGEEKIDKEIINPDGTSANKVASVDFSKYDYDIFAIKVTGFESDELRGVQLALGGYVIDNDKFTYLQPTKTTEGSLYTYESYNSLMA